MRALALAILLAPVRPAEDPVQAVRAALEKTGRSPYAYTVSGKYERAGEFAPPDTLTSRIRTYQSVRHAGRVLVKGPEGLWKAPEERLGEQTQKPDPDAAEIVRMLHEADAPHRMIAEILSEAKAAGDPQDREADGVPCRRYLFAFPKDVLRASLEKRIAKAVAAGAMDRPHEVQWGTAKGGLRIYTERKGGRLFRAVDDRSVKFSYARPEGPDVRTYRVEIEVACSDWGRAEVSLPREVKDRLGLRDEERNR